ITPKKSWIPACVGMSGESYSIRQAVSGLEGIDLLIAEHVRGKGNCAEYIGERSVADVEAAGISAECRHNHATLIGGEAAAAHRAAAVRQPRDRMEMTGDLPGFG